MMNNVLYLTKDIYLNEHDKFMKCFMEEVTKDTDEPLTFYINTNGGGLSDSFTLAMLIETSKRPITTVAMGQCYSGGTILLLAGKTRKCYAYSQLMFHNMLISTSWKTYPEYKHYNESRYDQDNKMMVQYYKYRLTGKAFKKLSTMLNADKEWWMYGEEALQYGIVNEVI